MTSLARRRHLQAVAAVYAATTAEQLPAQRQSGAPVTEYDLQRARLGVDLRRLKQIMAVEKKVAAKREMISAYDPWVMGVLQADAGGPDDIVIHMMIWSLDLEDYDRALLLTDYVLRHNLPLPERYTRTVATLIAEESANAALAHQGADEPFALDWLEHVDQVTGALDMHDQVRAKLKMAIGRAYQRQADAIEDGSDGATGTKGAALARASVELRRALQLNPKVGVKKDIERLERDLKKLSAGAPAT